MDEQPVHGVVERVALAAVEGPWPQLPDDGGQFAVVARPRRRERDRYLDDEQRGLPWNA
ncbi:hypothetical protein [Dactylosporangium matsuzakiense]|uniref:hypothetical protein n=1 Tax=Dactylosporangium matsuzakiense TaxID=53360 RepID=UPI0021C290EE|nr:hypothetical protein [Dactylosporangium matsuzakiense]UWZ41014.1 hypothetical protein Dmats_25150 [Dactylosporangium matsuzakiense]